MPRKSVVWIVSALFFCFGFSALAGPYKEVFNSFNLEEIEPGTSFNSSAPVEVRCSRIVLTKRGLEVAFTISGTHQNPPESLGLVIFDLSYDSELNKNRVEV